MNDGIEDEANDQIINQEISDLGYVNGDNDSFIEDPECSVREQIKTEF